VLRRARFQPAVPAEDQERLGRHHPVERFRRNRALRASPQIYFDVYKETFDYLHACEPGSLINVGLHSHFGGRPLMSAMFRKVL
jgi:allantoinase